MLSPLCTLHSLAPPFPWIMRAHWAGCKLLFKSRNMSDRDNIYAVLLLGNWHFDFSCLWQSAQCLFHTTFFSLLRHDRNPWRFHCSVTLSTWRYWNSNGLTNIASVKPSVSPPEIDRKLRRVCGYHDVFVGPISLALIIDWRLQQQAVFTNYLHVSNCRILPSLYFCMKAALQIARCSYDLLSAGSIANNWKLADWSEQNKMSKIENRVRAAQWCFIGWARQICMITGVYCTGDSYIAKFTEKS